MKRLIIMCLAIVLLGAGIAGAQNQPSRKKPAPPGAGPTLDDPLGDGADGEPAEEEEPPAGGTVRLVARKDKLTLTDGKVVEGSIVMAGNQAVVIVTAEGEMTIARAKVADIKRAQVTREMMLPRKFETLVVDGHEHVVVPLGLDDDTDDGPPGIIPGLTGPTAKGLARLRYKPVKGQTADARVELVETHVEDLPGGNRASRERRLKFVVKQAVDAATADKMWTVKARFGLKSFLRGFADVTALEAKRFGAVTVTRALSATGHWQPGADTVSGAGKRGQDFARWLGLAIVPLPDKPVRLGAIGKVEDLFPPDIARALLPLPDHVVAPTWQVTGTYTVKGTAEVTGLDCAIIAIDLQGEGGGDGAYSGIPAKLVVKAGGRWDVYFALDKGRPIECRVQSNTVTVGKTANGDVGCESKLVANVDGRESVAPAPTPKKPGPAPGPKKPTPDAVEVPGPAPEDAEDDALDKLMKKPDDAPPKKENLDRDLDDLMKKVNDPKFLDKKPKQK